MEVVAIEDSITGEVKILKILKELDLTDPIEKDPKRPG